MKITRGKAKRLRAKPAVVQLRSPGTKSARTEFEAASRQSIWLCVSLLGATQMCFFVPSFLNGVLSELYYKIEVFYSNFFIFAYLFIFCLQEIFLYPCSSIITSKQNPHWCKGNKINILFFLIHIVGVECSWVHSARRPLTGLLYLPRGIMMMENLVEWRLVEETEKPVPTPFWPPQIPVGPTRDWTCVAAVGRQRLTAWTVARPIHPPSYHWICPLCHNFCPNFGYAFAE
jgi:hypothetical protein